MSEQQQYTVSIDLEIIDEQQMELLIEEIGPRGPVGVTPNIQIGTVTTLEAGEQATATMTGSAEEPVLNMGIPQGMPGGNVVLDDTAGIGDTDKVWSADNTARKFADKSGVIFKTISTPAAVQTFDDGADNLPVKQMVIGIEPVQDLHGYDHPWPGGGNKNLFPYGIVEITNNSGFDGEGEIISAENYDVTDYIALSPSTGYSFSGNTTQSGTALSVCEYDTNHTFIAKHDFKTKSGNRAYGSFTTDATCAYVRIQLKKGILTTDRAQFDTFQIETGLTVTDFVPYSNICPITGWTGANIKRYGKNLIDPTGLVQGALNGSTGILVSSTTRVSTDYIPVAAGKTYVASVETGKKFVAYHYYNSSKAEIGSNVTTNPYETPSNAAYVRIMFGNSDDSDIVPTDIKKAQFEEGSTATEYKPYTTYHIAFPSAAGTVYGGELTVNEDGSGTLVVDSGYGSIPSIISSSLTSKNGEKIWRVYGNQHTIPATSSDYASQICDKMKTGNVLSGAANVTVPTLFYNPGSQDIRWCVPGLTTNTAALEWLANNPVSFVFKLATPTTYTLTAPEIRTIIGLNNIWADTGNVNSITYRTDENINYEIDRVENRVEATQAMIAPVLDGMVADTALAVNDFRIVDGTLYRVTAPIAAEAALTVGTNVVKTSIGEQLTALLNA